MTVENNVKGVTVHKNALDPRKSFTTVSRIDQKPVTYVGKEMPDEEMHRLSHGCDFKDCKTCNKGVSSNG